MSEGGKTRCKDDWRKARQTGVQVFCELGARLKLPSETQKIKTTKQAHKRH